MSIENAVKITIYTNSGYYYEAECDAEIVRLKYIEDDDHQTTVGFGSIDEMEAAANAMLKVAKMAREMKIM